MKLKKVFFGCIVFIMMLAICYTSNAEHIADSYVYEAESTPYTVNGAEGAYEPITEEDVTYIIYKNEDKGANDNISFEVDVPKTGRYEISLVIKKTTTSAANYDWYVDGKQVKHRVYFVRFLDTWHTIDLGQHTLTQGTHTVGIYGSTKGSEIQVDKVELTESNNQTFYMINEYNNGNITVSENSTPISVAVTTDFYCTVRYDANAEGDYVSLKLTTETCGLFDVSFIIKCGNAADGTFDLYIDGNEIKKSVNFKSSGADYIKIDFGQADLAPGIHDVRLVASGTVGRAMLSEMKLTAVREGFGIYAPEISTCSGDSSSITEIGDITTRASVYNYENDKELILVQLYYDKTGGTSVLKDIVMTPITVKSGECKVVEHLMSIPELYDEGMVSAFVCDYTDGIFYPDSKVVTIPCMIPEN